MKEIKEHQAIFQPYFDKSSDLMATTGPDGRFSMVNPACTKLLGWTADELCSQPTINFVHPDDVDIHQDAFELAIDGDRKIFIDERFRCRDGAYVLLRWQIQPDGDVFYGIAHEITEQTATLADSQALLNLTARTARLGGWELDLATNTAEWTGAIFEIFGLPVGTPVSLEHAINFFHSEDRHIIADAVQNAIDNHVPFNVEVWATTVKGRPIHVRAIGQAVVVDGKTTKLWGSLQDITGQVEQTAALADSQALLEQTARIARFGGWVRDLQTHKDTWTGALFEIFGVPEGDIVTSKEALDFYHPDDRPILVAAVQDVIDNGTPYDLVVRAHTTKGEPLHIRTIGTPVIIDGKTTKLWGSLQDITDRVNQLTALSDSQALLDLTARTARLGGWELDLATNTAEWTGAIFEIFDTPEGIPVPLEDALNFYHPDDRHIIADAVQIAIDSHVPFDVVVRAHTTKGEPLHVRSIGQPVIVDGKTTKLWGSLQDITEQVEHNQKLQSAFTGTIEALGRVVDIGDPYTASHQREVSHLATTIATELGLSDDRVDGVRFGALIHDIGKVAMPAQILVKPGRLTPLEYEMVKTHSQVGYDIVAGVEYPWPIAEIVLQHHERIDGSGYPNGLKGNEIILEAQIVGVADVVEAMTARRPYREGLGIEVALDEITRNRGTLYNADVVDICVRLFREEDFDLTYE